MERKEYKSSYVRYTLLLAISLGFVAIGVCGAHGAHDTVKLITMLACSLFFGACAVIFIRQIFDRRPRIIIDESGIFDRTLKIGKIDWNDIEDAYVRRINREPFICLKLREDTKYTGKMSKIGEMAAKSNEIMGFTPIALNLSGVAVKPEELCEMILSLSAKAKNHN